MDVKLVLKNQYHAALKTLKLAIEHCPPELWTGGDAPPDPPDPLPFWRVAYHTLFFTHFYLQPSREALRPWKHHRWGCENFDSPTAAKDVFEPYTKEQVLEYWGEVDARVDADIDSMDLAAATSGFPWYKMSKLEHQVANIRHIQHHAAILSARLRRGGAPEVEWVSGV